MHGVIISLCSWRKSWPSWTFLLMQIIKEKKINEKETHEVSLMSGVALNEFYFKLF
jgi:hypothetical protein